MLKFNTKLLKHLSLVLIACLLSSCYSSTVIYSNPPGAKAYVNGEYIGMTPCEYGDEKIIGSTNRIRLEKQGYETFNATFSRNEVFDPGACAGGVFFTVPFLWIMKYNPSRTFHLDPIMYDDEKLEVVPVSEREQKMRELQRLLDEKLITEEDYQVLKKKVLESF